MASFLLGGRDHRSFDDLGFGWLARRIGDVDGAHDHAVFRGLGAWNRGSRRPSATGMAVTFTTAWLQVAQW